MKQSVIYLKLVLTTVFWASVFHIGKYAVAFVSPFYAGAWRFLLAAFILIPLVAMTEGWPREALKRSAFGLLVMSAVGVFGFNACLFFGLRHTSAVNSALIMAFSPALTAAFSALINREPLLRHQLIGLVCGIAGVIVVISKGSWHALANMAFSSGDLLVLLAAACWAIYPVIPKRFVKGLSSMQIAGSTIAGGAVLLALFAVESSTAFFAPPPMPVAIGIVCMGVFGSVLAYLWWNQGIQELGATSVAVYLNLVPMFTAMIGVALGQPIAPAQILGALLVIVGVLYSSGKLNALGWPAIRRASLPIGEKPVPCNRG